MAVRIEDLIQKWSPEIQRAFMAAIYAIRDKAQIGVIATCLEKGDVDGALRAVGLDPSLFRGLDKTIGDAFEGGGNAFAANIPASTGDNGFRLKIGFDARNLRAESWLRGHSSTLVTAILDDQRTMIRDVLTAGMEKGENPRDVALDLVGRISATTGKREGGVIGLTASQEQWARNYESEIAGGSSNALTRELRDKRFDKTVAKAIKDGKPIPADLQAKIVAAYRNRALRYRAESIGRTEAMTSLHQSQHEAFQQGVDAGQVRAQDVRKVWRSAEDQRVRHTHSVLNGESVGMGQPFVSPSGAKLQFPGDPSAPAAEVVNCRCNVDYRVDFLANVS